MLGLIALTVALIASYARNPAGAKSLFGGFGTGYGLKVYYEAMVAILLFFVTYWGLHILKLELRKILSLISATLFITCVIRVLTYFGLIDFPFLSGSLAYLEYTGPTYSDYIKPFRIGGLSHFAALSTVCATTLLAFQSRGRMRNLIFAISSGAMVILGGGRSAFVGVCAGLLFLGILVRPSKSIIVTIIAVLTIGALGLFRIGRQDVADVQFQRILDYESITQREKHRISSYEILIEGLVESPILGRGIQPIPFQERAKYQDVGSHGAYFSVIGLFGLLGITYLILFLIVPVVGSTLTLLRNRKNIPDQEGLIAMVFFSAMLVVFSFIMGAGGGGYTEPHLFLLVGGLVYLHESLRFRRTNSKGYD
ncbi:MAG: hypothetical protein GF309_11295 [Candidatus Lokiarchaeota archaeon]|nr:hypothetical protein [Candidatus Lokiarchaeota archaeon]